MNSAAVPIERLYSGLFDGPHATPKPSDSGPVFLGIGNITEDGKLDLSDVRRIAEEDYPAWTKRVVPEAGDIVFTYEATLNRYAIIPEGFRGCLGRRTALIRPNPAEVNPRYLFFYFFGPDWRRVIDSNILSGATVDRIPLSKFPGFPVMLPPREAQDRIADILSAYDDLIENNTRRIKILEEMARMLYREWFVHFRFPGHEKVRMVDSELGPIPEGWVRTCLGELCQESRRSVHPREVESETPYVGLEHIPRASIALSGWGYAKDVTSVKTRFNCGDILFGKIRPYFHKVSVAPISGVASSDAIVIVPRSGSVYSAVLCCVSSAEFVGYATKTSQGTKMPRASWSVLAKYPLPMPLDQSVLLQFNETVTGIVRSLGNLVLRNRNLRATRDLLLPKLISGEIPIEAAADTAAELAEKAAHA